MAKAVRVQVPEVLPLGKSLEVAVGTRRLEVARFVGSKSEHLKRMKSAEGQKMRTMPPWLAF